MAQTPLITPIPIGSLELMPGVMRPPWLTWLTQAYALLFANQQSGTTANRPISGLWIGRRYFDTSLGANGKPIWIAAVSASGAATWIDAASNIV